MSKKKPRLQHISESTTKDVETSKPNTVEEKFPTSPNQTFETLKNHIQAQFSQLPKPASANKSPAAHPSQQKRPQNRSKQGHTQGKKRDREGNFVPHGNAFSSRTKTDTDAPPEDEAFQNEVRALGGTSEDIDLIAGADSGSEMEGEHEHIENQKKPSQNSHGLQRGISNILKEIKLAQGTENSSEDSTDTDAGGKVEVPTNVKEHTAPAKAERKSKTSNLRCEPLPDWYQFGELEMKTDRPAKYTPSKSLLEEVHSVAKSLLYEENEMFRASQKSSSSHSFYNTVITSGTLSDKISALTLAVQESPVHNVKALETLTGLSKKRSRSQAVDVLRALKDLFGQGSLLPSARRLYTFSAQPALLVAFGSVKSWRHGDKLPEGLKETHLIAWAFESWLKEQYFEVLQTLEVWCNDELEFSKSRAISYVYELLKEKPEQESNLLRLLINKLGDPIKKVASQTSYLLMQLLATHPAMKGIVVSAIESDFIFRPGQSMHGKYYASITLNQTALSAKEEDVAVKLLGIYFGLFTSILKTPVTEPAMPQDDQPSDRRRHEKKRTDVESGQAQTEELREKLISAILTGVNRAYPYVGADDKSFSQHLDTLFKIAHSSNFNTGVQAMLLIQQISSSHQPSSDRFYRLLYESLLDPRLISASKQQLYLNLMHRALKADLNMKRIKAFVKRILQILSLHEPPFICGAFFLLKDLEGTLPALTALVDQSEDHDDDEEVFRDVEEDEGRKPGDDDHAAPALANLYDAHKRAPEHANADNSSAWEVIPFLAHFHPSVAISADHYLRHAKLPGKPDLTLHTLIHFLDRFVYRNAKIAGSKLRGSSIMQPVATDNAHAVLINPTVGGLQRLAVNSEEFRNKKDEDVAVQDVFFHKYFTTLGKDAAKKTWKRSAQEVDEAGSGGEDEVWKAMIESAPDLEGEGSSDEDLGMSDLESDMQSGEDDGDEEQDQDQDGESEVDVEAGIFDDNDDDLIDMGNDEDILDLEGDESDEEDVGLSGKQTSEVKKAVVPVKDGKKNDKERRKQLKSLPMFASAADYAKMLDEDDDEDF